VLKFCRARDLPLEGVALKQRMIRHPETNLLERVELDVEVPASFPEKYHRALVRAAEQCAVKRAIDRALPIETRAVVV
jgi:ribosomal protein S12 methylthiotransferase accessory factor